MYGAEQCFWSREWASAQKQFYDSCQSSVGINYIETDSRIEGWFRESSPSKVIDSYVNSCGPGMAIHAVLKLTDAINLQCQIWLMHTG